jgi:hypothetical protein
MPSNLYEQRTSMPEIFVNYRTGDEESAATLIDEGLARRFGRERVFFASKSIEPGRRFPEELTRAVEGCQALVAVIGPRWTEVRGPDGNPAFLAEHDWTCREIETALARGVLVIPVLVGKATRIDSTVLPPRVKELADCQYRRFDHRNNVVDQRALGDALARLLPELGAVDLDEGRVTEGKTAKAPKTPNGFGTEAGVRAFRSGDVRGGIGNLAGDLSGTFVNEPQGPVNTGRGHQYNAPHFEGDNTGVQFTAGDNSATVHQRFERGPRHADDER